MARLISVLALILVVGGCAAGTPGSQPRVDPFDPAEAGSDDVLLTILNNDFRDASIYANWNGLKMRV